MGQVVFASGRTLGHQPGAFVIAEIGVNHDGDLAVAEAMVDVAAEAGVDAVKLQTFKADRLVSTRAPQARYQAARDPQASQHAMLRRLELSPADHHRLAARAAERGLILLSSPFDTGSLELLVELGVPAIKLGSGELTNAPLLERAAATGLPLILSSGMAWLSEVTAAVELARRAGAVDLAVLHCVSRYPAPIELSNLRALDTLAAALGEATVVGYSDHTLGVAAPVAAVARGARIIEKHFTLDRARPGPDHAASADPAELTAMVRLIRQVEAALGESAKRPQPGEEELRYVARRGLHLARDVAAGAVLVAEDLIALRPAEGLPPSRLSEVLGLVAARPLRAGDPLRLGDLAPAPEAG